MSVYRRKRPDGTLYETYTCSFELGGTRVNEDTGLRSKAEALKWQTAKRKEVASQVASRRLMLKPDRLTVAKALERYWDEKLSLSKSAKNEKFVKDKLKREIGSVELHELTTAVLMQLVARKLKSGLAPSTVRRELVILHAMHEQAREVWEYPGLRAIAWRKIRPELPHTEIEIPPLTKVRELYLSASSRLGVAILFAVLTGLRLHEIRNLTAEKYTPETRTIRFKGKGGKTVNLPLSSAATSVIALALTSRGLSMPLEPSCRLFDMTNFTREWNDARKKAGLPSTRFHDLRHVFATLFRSSTDDPMHLMTAMRHSDISTSLGYVHADKSPLLPSLEKVAEQLLQSSPALSNLLPPKLPEPAGE